MLQLQHVPVLLRPRYQFIVHYAVAAHAATMQKRHTTAHLLRADIAALSEQLPDTLHQTFIAGDVFFP